MVFADLPSLITLIFLLVILSYYVLLFKKPKKPPKEKDFKSLTIIIPAHNEEDHIAEAIQSVQNAYFHGKKEIIVVDDGSKDRTAHIAASYDVILLQQKHLGKSTSLNRALAQAKGEIVAIVDGDSAIEPGALQAMAEELGREGIGAACGVVRVRNRKRILCMWAHIEQLYNSLMRSLWSKMNANVVTPGPLSMYRMEGLQKIGGFKTEGFSEDIDVTIRLIREGYHIGFAENSISETNMPYTPKEFLRQRMRFARGMVNILKRHLRLNTTIIDLYTLPLFLFYYVQCQCSPQFPAALMKANALAPARIIPIVSVAARK